MKKFILLFTVMLFLAGCSNDEDTTQRDKIDTANTLEGNSSDSSKTATEGFAYDYNGVIIPMNVDAAPIIKELGEPVEYFEAASCAFQGLDKIFYYNGFELGTYPVKDKDYVSYVNLLDDSVSTDQGIYLGSTLEDLVAAYGENYTEDGSSYLYRLGDTKLTFIIEEDTVTSITYYAIIEGLNN